MRFEERASREQIAADLQISQNGVKNLQQRAKSQLRQCLEEKLGAVDR
jgi:RNA polymerase sigma-70 factor (ECF subfamily)